MNSSVAVESPSLPTHNANLFGTAGEGAPAASIRPSVTQEPSTLPGRKALQLELLQALDTAGALALLFAIWLGLNLYRLHGGMDGFLAQRVTIKNAILVSGFTFLWPRLMSLAGLYEPGAMSVRSRVMRVFAACSVGSICAFAFPLSSISGSFRFEAVLYFWVGSMALTLAVRTPFRPFGVASLNRPMRRVIIVGSGPRALRVAQEIQGAAEACELLGFVDSDDHFLSGRMEAPKLGTLEELEAVLMHRVVDEVLIALPIKSCYEEIQHAIRVCERTGTESKYLADVFDCSLARPRFEHADTLPVVAFKTFHDDHRVYMKRAVDFVAALLGLLALSPLLVLVAVAIKLDSRGPVFFVQERYGRNKRRFRMFKFRTMVPNAEALISTLEDRNEAIGPAFKIKDDPRVTRLGKWLRKTSLDEIPQLINVLKGDMSLVGPRPMAVRDVQLFDQAWFMRRFSAPPGMTGLWQVSGRSNLGFDDWVALDLKYIDEWSLALDMKILSRTLPAVLRNTGAF